MHKIFVVIGALFFLLACGTNPSSNSNNGLQNLEKFFTTGVTEGDNPPTDEQITLEGMAPWGGITLNNPVTYGTYCLVNGQRSSNCECWATRRKLTNPGGFTYPLTVIENDRYSALESFDSPLPEGEYEINFYCSHNGHWSDEMTSNFFSTGLTSYLPMSLDMTWPTENTVTKFPDNKIDLECKINNEIYPCECEADIKDINDPSYLIHLNDSDFNYEESHKTAIFDLTHSTNFRLELTCQYHWWRGKNQIMFTKVFYPIMSDIKPVPGQIMTKGDKYTINVLLEEESQFENGLVSVDDARCGVSMWHMNFDFFPANIKLSSPLHESMPGLFNDQRTATKPAFYYFRFECSQKTGMAFSPIMTFTVEDDQ